jgi:hypothetical protein
MYQTESKEKRKISCLKGALVNPKLERLSSALFSLALGGPAYHREQEAGVYI